jgi:ubiquinone/menaquinone biosynthesis C-methylase UbiE
MNAQYDAIAEQYARTKSSPLRTWVERPSFLELLGDVTGTRVLDLACGDGFYTRLIKQAGAIEVVGVDVSPAMIALARQAECEEQLGLSYECADVAALPDLGQFDLVTAAYLLHYAPDRAALAAMCGNIARCLASGARFVTLNENPDCPAEPGGAYVQYGFTKSLEGELRDGADIRYRMLAGRDSFAFDVRYYTGATYEQELTRAGMSAVTWHPLTLDPAGDDAMGPGYFRAYLDHPPVIGLSCRRA